MGLIRTAAPETEPVTAAEAKLHCRIDGSDDDSLVAALITAAREHVEEVTERALIEQTWRLTLAAFPCGRLLLPRPRLIAVSSIVYLDTDGASQTLDSSLYRVDATSEPGSVEPAYGTSWPDTYAVSGAVTVTFTAGYGTEVSAVPQAIKQAVLLLVGAWYENREGIITGTIVAKTPLAVEALLGPYRMPSAG